MRLTTDFQTNKKVCEEVAIIPSKALRNKIAGFVSVSGNFTPCGGHAKKSREIRKSVADCLFFWQHLMKRINRGPVRGISLKLQEEERERRMDVIPEKSALAPDTVEIDPETQKLLQFLAVNMGPKVTVVPLPAAFSGNRPFGGGNRGRRE